MVLRLIAGGYVVFCALSLILLGAAIYGWFGADRDPIGAAFAILLALPWAALLGQLETDQPWKIVLVLIASMSANLVIIIGVGIAFRRVLHRKRNKANF